MEECKQSINHINGIAGSAPVFTSREHREQQERDYERGRVWEQLIEQRGARYAECRLNNYQTETDEQKNVVEKLRAYIETINSRIDRGEGILLFGPKGAGKDHLLMACARGAVAHYHKVVWINGMDLFGRVRSTMSNSGETEGEIFYELSRPKVLWISDPLPPSGALTEFQQTFLFRLLDYRYSHLLTTWACCNVTSGAELDARIGAQNGDRLRHGALALFTNWASYRKVAEQKPLTN